MADGACVLCAERATKAVEAAEILAYWEEHGGSFTSLDVSPDSHRCSIMLRSGRRLYGPSFTETVKRAMEDR